MLDSFLLISLVLSSVNRSIYPNQIVTSVHLSEIQILRTNAISTSLHALPANKNTSKSKMIVTPLRLQIWENDPRLPLPGASPTANRPIGFASISMTFENKTEQPINLRLQTIAIFPVGSKQPLMSLAATDLTLGPLEIAPQQYQLSNQEGYGNLAQVEAVVIYQLDGQSHTLRSSSVNVSE